MSGSDDAFANDVPKSIYGSVTVDGSSMAVAVARWLVGAGRRRDDPVADDHDAHDGIGEVLRPRSPKMRRDARFRHLRLFRPLRSDFDLSSRSSTLRNLRRLVRLPYGFTPGRLEALHDDDGTHISAVEMYIPRPASPLSVHLSS
jgi:hypothetical protein